MRKVWSIVSAGLLGLLAAAAQAAPPTQEERMQAIWDAAYNRITDQVDSWYEVGDYPRVAQLLRLQRELYPQDYEVATNLGWILESIEEYPEALAIYVDFRKDNPADPDASFPEAFFYFMRKAYAKVPPLLEPTLKRKPHKNTYRILAAAYERLNLLSDAKRVWAEFLKVEPNDNRGKANLERVEKKMKGDAPPNNAPSGAR